MTGRHGSHELVVQRARVGKCCVEGRQEYEPTKGLMCDIWEWWGLRNLEADVSRGDFCVQTSLVFKTILLVEGGPT